VVDSAGVGERVAADAGGDREPESKPRRRGVTQTPDEQDSACNEEDSACLRGRGADPECRDSDEEDENRRQPAGDRIDDAQLRPPIGGGQERKVGELERRRDDHVRDRLRLHVPAEGGDGPEREHREREGERGRGGNVVSPSEREVPRGVKPGGAERQGKRVSRHLEDDCDGPVVHQLNRHPGAEPTRLNTDAEVAQ
jgi:hypothetical protein